VIEIRGVLGGHARRVRLSADTTTLVYVLAGILGAATVATLGLRGNPAALGVGAAVAGGIALACGIVELLRGWYGPNPALFVKLVGLALTIWGAGQLMFCLGAVLGTPRFPSPGDGLGAIAVPVAVAAVLAMPRFGRHNSPRLRLGLDSALLGPAAALLIWELAFVDRVADRAVLSGPVIGLVATLVGALVIASLLGLVCVREPGIEIACVTAGITTFVAGEFLALYMVLGGTGVWPWEAPVLWCLGWSLIAVGLPRMHRAVARQGVVLRPVENDPDARVVVVTTTLCLGFLAAGLITMMLRGEPDPVGLYLVLIAVGLFWSREMLDARLRTHLLNRLEDEAMTDPLTAIANRRTLTTRISELPPDESWCLLSLDLDGFKEVNDLLGHAVGDQLLRSVALRMLGAAPEESLVARTGGDEFAILVRGDVEQAVEIGRRVVTAVRRSASDVDGVNRVDVSVSVGVAEVNGADGEGRTDAVDPLGALSASGTALRAAKQTGRDRVVVFDGALAQSSRRRLRIEDRLRRAVANGQVQVRFQPIVDLRENRLSGAEALARWNDPDLGDVPPAEFIPLAEQTGLVTELGEYLLFSTLRSCRDSGYFDEGLRVNYNVSPVQLRAPGLDVVVEQALSEFGVEPHQLVIEITESVLVEEDGPAVRTLRTLAEQGVTIAIDDFGTGYSALGYLRRLPAHMLKVDRSMTRGVMVDAESRALVGAIIDLGRAVGLDVVVEGVEEHAVGALALDLGAAYAQGLWYGDAMPVEDLVMLAQNRMGSPLQRPIHARRLA
jgi:diguanylate cyclase (GGDEF)-like protein